MADPTGGLSGQTLGRYRLAGLVGRGGMGDVYRAEDHDLRRWVALKVLPAHLVDDSDRLSRFVQEARAASSLNHPNLVSIYDVGSAAADGSEIFYTTIERSNVWRRKVTGGEPVKLSNFSDLAIFRFALSPNGRTLLVSRGAQTRDAFSITGFR